MMILEVISKMNSEFKTLLFLKLSFKGYVYFEVYGLVMTMIYTGEF